MGILFSSGLKWKPEDPILEIIRNEAQGTVEFFVTKLTADLLMNQSVWESLAEPLSVDTPIAFIEVDNGAMINFTRDGKLFSVDIYYRERRVKFSFTDDSIEDEDLVIGEFNKMVGDAYRHLNNHIDARNSAVALALVNKGANLDALDIVSSNQFGQSIRNLAPAQTMAPEEGRREYARVYSRTLQYAAQQYD